MEPIEGFMVSVKEVEAHLALAQELAQSIKVPTTLGFRPNETEVAELDYARDAKRLEGGERFEGE